MFVSSLQLVAVHGSVEDLIEPELRRWLRLDGGPLRPKHPEELWKRGRRD